MQKTRDSRQLILEAARAALIEREGGFEMSEIARRAGVSVGLAYHYFRSKDGLISAVVEAFYDRYDAIVNQRFEPGLVWPEREKRRLISVVSYLFEDPLAPVMLGRLSGARHVADVEARRRADIIALATDNIARAQRRGAIDPTLDPALAAALINGGLRQAIAIELSKPNPMPAQDFADRAWALIASTLRL